MKSTPKSAEHRIIVKTTQDQDGSLKFQVSDNGGGMSEETKRKIFASFYSTKGSRGTGLGLMVTSKIVMEHGGAISFDSQEGMGSTFTIMLPPRESREGVDHNIDPWSSWQRQRKRASKALLPQSPRPIGSAKYRRCLVPMRGQKSDVAGQQGGS